MKYGYSYKLKNSVKIAAYGSEVQAVINYANSQGYTLPNVGVLSALNTMVEALKTAGAWSKFDVFYALATNGDSDFAKINIINPGSFSCTDINTPTFVSLQGFKGDSVSNSGLNTNFIPATNSVKWDTANKSASFGAYVYALHTNGNGLMGTEFGGNSKRTGGYTVINGIAPGSDSIETGTNHINFKPTGREFLINGVQTVFSAVTTSNANSINPLVLCGESTTTNFSDVLISIAWLGASLAAEAAAIHSAFSNYVTTINS